MSNVVFRFTASLPIAFAVAVGLGAGCAEESPASVPVVKSQPEPADGTTNAGETRVPSVSADAATDFPRRGSPLCNVTAATCMPDDDGRRVTPYGTAACTLQLGDAGLDIAADAAPYIDGCRIAKQGETYAPKCYVKAADRLGFDGTSCEKGADCAPGFDCVDGEKGSVCRRYCCWGTCEGETAQNGGATFCDIQKLVEENPHKAPVCMPIKKCALLAPGECGDRETCAVVTEKGETGCVANGGAKQGDSCDTEHCDANLTCIGSPGDRRCYKLCTAKGTECAGTQTCITSALFQGTTFGVCKTATP